MHRLPASLVRSLHRSNQNPNNLTSQLHQRLNHTRTHLASQAHWEPAVNSTNSHPTKRRRKPPWSCRRALRTTRKFPPQASPSSRKPLLLGLHSLTPLPISTFRGSFASGVPPWSPTS